VSVWWWDLIVVPASTPFPRGWSDREKEGPTFHRRVVRADDPRFPSGERGATGLSSLIEFASLSGFALSFADGSGR